jgi:hypothetical protein
MFVRCAAFIDIFATEGKKLTDRKSALLFLGSSETMDQLKGQNIHNLQRMCSIRGENAAEEHKFTRQFT